MWRDVFRFKIQRGMWLCGVFIPKPSRIGAGDYRLISCCFSRSRSNTVLPSIRRLLHNLLAFRAFSRMVSEVTAYNRRTLITICCRRVLSKYFFSVSPGWKKKCIILGIPVKVMRSSSKYMKLDMRLG